MLLASIIVGLATTLTAKVASKATIWVGCMVTIVMLVLVVWC
jgi:hypothetical protein